MVVGSSVAESMVARHHLCLCHPKLMASSIHHIVSLPYDDDSCLSRLGFRRKT